MYVYFCQIKSSKITLMKLSLNDILAEPENVLKLDLDN